MSLIGDLDARADREERAGVVLRSLGATSVTAYRTKRPGFRAHGRSGAAWSGSSSEGAAGSGGCLLPADWWAPDDLRVSELVFEARPGGRIVLEYRDVEDADGSDVVVGRAEGVVDDVRAGERLTYRSSPTLPDGTLAFTAHVDIGLRRTDTDIVTDVDVEYRITDSTVGSAEFIAGIEIGFGQSLDSLAAAIAADPESTHQSDARSKK